MPELKPCPFCGGEAQIIEQWIQDPLGRARVDCSVCRAGFDQLKKEQLIKLWNTRTSPWVSVNESMPDEGKWYLIATSHPGFNERISTMAFLDSCGSDPIWLSHNDEGEEYQEWENVTHWMPLPEPPEVNG